MKKKRVFLTGGGGFIGANLVRRLVQDNYEVHLLLRKTTALWRLKDVIPDVKVHPGDLSNRDRLEKILKKALPQYIFHLASYGNYSTQKGVDETVNTNILGTLNLLRASRKINYRCLVNTGSSSEYGFKEKPMRENDVCQPISFYAATKLSATVLCQVFARVYQKPIVTIRPFSVYGPYEKKDRFIPTIILSLINKQSIKLTSGTIRRDFVYIDDLIDAYLQSLKIPIKVSGKIINVGTGREYTNDEVVKTLFRVIGRSVSVEKGAYPARKWDTSHWRADNSLAKKLLCWQPRFSLTQGLEETFQWFLNNKSLYEK